jgi:hypothetical protein
MMKTTPHLITESNLSTAWARAYLHAHDGADDALVVAIRDFTGEIPAQDKLIAEELDGRLSQLEIPRIGQTALTIVPYEKWLREGKMEIHKLSDWYLESMLPRLRARCSKNRHGTYFERLVAYSGTNRKGGREEPRTVNQLAYIIDLWKKKEANFKPSRPRQSALQLACFDPAKDDTGSALSGFPCLQQVSFTYHEAGSLELNAYYPTQYLFDRAYGNYLGLCQLGHLVAHAIGVRLTRFTCFTARPEEGHRVKDPGFIDLLRKHVDENSVKTAP